MCSAPTCHVANVRPSINSPHLGLVSCNTPEYQCLWFQFYRAFNFYCMAIAADSSSPTGLPLAADWVAAGVAAASETSVTAAAIVASATVAVCNASAESLSPSGQRAIRTRGAQREEASQQEVEAPVNRRRQRDERQHDNQLDERHERGRRQRKQQQLQLCNNQQNRNGTKMRSSSHREVAARRLTWRCRLRNCRGGSKAAMMTTTRR